MRKLSQKLMDTGRLLIVGMILIAVPLSGAGAAERLFSAYEDLCPKNESETAELVPGPLPAEEAPENMEPTGKPYCEQPARISAPLSLHNQNENQRDFNTSSAFSCLEANSPERRRNSILKTSTAAISSSLSRRFTLVGARPSGTG